MYEYLQTGVDTCMYMCIKYRAQQAMILQTTLYFSWALGAGVTEALHPQCSLVYLACLVPSVSVSPLVQKLRAGTKFPAVPQPHHSALLCTDVLSFCLSA